MKDCMKSPGKDSGLEKRQKFSGQRKNQFLLSVPVLDNSYNVACGPVPQLL